MDVITHLVHIGFHTKPTPEFDEAIVKHIGEIASNTNHIVNFVNIKNDSAEDAERRQNLIFFEKLALVIAGHHLMSTPMRRYVGNFEETLKRELIPQEVADWIYENYKNSIDILRGTFITRFGNRDIGPTPEEIEADNAYKDFMNTKFQECIEGLIKRFEGVNIFRLPVIGENGVPEFHQNNPQRYHSLLSHALKVLGEERVKNTFLNDGQLKSLRVELEMKKEIDETGISEGPSQSYGNAETLFATLRSQDGIEWINSVFEYIWKNIGKDTFYNAQHIVGGEYFGRCVHTQKSFLSRMGLSSTLSNSLCLTTQGTIACKEEVI